MSLNKQGEVESVMFEMISICSGRLVPRKLSIRRWGLTEGVRCVRESGKAQGGADLSANFYFSTSSTKQKVIRRVKYPAGWMTKYIYSILKGKARPSLRETRS